MKGFKIVNSLQEAIHQLRLLQKPVDPATTSNGETTNMVDGKEYDIQELIKLANSVLPETWNGNANTQPRIAWQRGIAPWRSR